MTENELLEQVRHLAIDELGLLATHIPDSRRLRDWSNGFPDTLILSPAGRGILVPELKIGAARPSSGQRQWFYAFQANTEPPVPLVWTDADWHSGEIRARLLALTRP